MHVSCLDNHVRRVSRASIYTYVSESIFMKWKKLYRDRVDYSLYNFVMFRKDCFE